MQALHRSVQLRAPDTELWLERIAEYHNQSAFLNGSGSELNRFSNLEDIDVAGDGSPELRIMLAIVYSVVCAVGLVGNLLVFFLMKVRQGRKKSTINFFILNLAVTDFQFVLALPFWAVELALDFNWPFGHAMCKIVLTVTVMNVYASTFFLTAMSVTRYWSVASALKDRTRNRTCSVKLVTALLWVLAFVATAPTTIFSTVRKVNDVKLCLLRFPRHGQNWLAIYHMQKILVAFVLPMQIITVCYLLLLRLIRQRSMNNNLPKRQSKVTKSVTIVVLSFFLCWLPNHAITFWGVLVKLNVVEWDRIYYIVHTYVFPVTICLATTNSCLNPVLYCLMRREFRKMLKDFFWRISSPAIANSCQVRPFSGTAKDHDDSGVRIPLNVMETEQFRLSVVNGQCDALPATECAIIR